MKKTFLTLLLVGVASSFVNAQDLIVLKDAQEIEAKVEAITQTEISYHKWSNPSGPLYTISKAEVFFIKYQNGEKDIISEQTAPQQQSDAAISVANGNYSSKLNPRRAGRVTFDGYLNFAGYAGFWFGPGLDLSLGVNLFDYAYTGLQVGFDYVFASNIEGYIIPIGVNVKGYIPCNGRVYPFVDWTIGAGVGGGSCFHNALLFGCDFSRFSLSFGWDLMGGASTACFKLGVRLGKIK